MKRIYMDNGATSFPKAPGVVEAMVRYMTENGATIGRGSYEDAFEAQRTVIETREKMATLFGFDHANHVVFTKNVTESLNILIKGLLHPGDHVIISPLEHNAVMRPLTSLGSKGITYSKASCDGEGHLRLESIVPLIKPETKAIIMTHASNVCGTLLDLEAVGKIAEAYGLSFIVDAAQTAGIIPIDFKALKADAIAFTGHKALLGPQGTGGFVLTPALADRIEPFIEGGTGSASDLEIQPSYMPDKFESGTPNTVGLVGLHAALCYLEMEGLESRFLTEMNLTQRFIQGLEGLRNIRLVGAKDVKLRTAVVSLDFLGADNAAVCWRLEKEYGILTRVGMHCAPSAHKALGTYPQGTVRFSFSHFTTTKEVDIALDALNTINSER